MTNPAMSSRTLSRRHALRVISAGVLAAPSVLAARSADAQEKKGDQGQKTGEVEDCTKGVELSESSKKMRKTLQYVSRSPKKDKQCSNCLQWIPPEKEGSPCGGCKLFSGPVHEKGYCLSWAPAQQ